MILTGFAIIVFVIIGSILLAGENPLLIWDSVSLALNIGIITASLTAANLMGDFFRGWKYLLGRMQVYDRKDIEAAILSFDLAYKSSLASGIIGFIMGIVLMLVNLTDVKYIWAYLAICLLAVLYGIVLAFGLFLPCRSRLKKMADGKND